MIRKPLRPLARILSARRRGENPDLIERENIRLRHEKMRDGARQMAEGRLLVLGAFFVLAFGTVGLRMTALATHEPVEPRSHVTGASIIAQRSDIVDRNGRILATNLVTNALYAQPPLMTDKTGSARELARIFPDLDENTLLAQFSGTRKFLWIKKKISPEQQQLVYDVGDPGLLFGPREMRLYPNGKLAAHVLGGASFGREGVNSAELVGVAGVEMNFDVFLRDPANDGEPVRLSLDLTLQSATEQVLEGGMKLLNARGASSVLMDVHSGEILSMASLPTFDPNNRPNSITKGHAGDSPLFNRALQGVYELGSVFKIFTAAQAVDSKLFSTDSVLDTRGPLKWGRYKISDFRNYGNHLTVTDTIVKSSNIGTARMAMAIGVDRQRAFFRDLGFFDPTPVELIEAPSSKPIIQKNWSEITTITAAYGQGIAVSPVHLAAAYATIVNGGTRVTPTLIVQDNVETGARVISPETSLAMRSILRQVVTRGTASFGEVEGYAVGGKTGTADKPKPTGGYYKDKVISTFASVFPATNPRYVLIVTLDEPEENSGSEPRRTAGWTAVPVAAEMIRRLAPLLGLRPEIEPTAPDRLTLASN